LSSTSTNKQPLLVDRPLIDTVRVTTQTVGSASTNTLFVQGGQAPSILVDMDATLSEDNSSGGVIDSITITRNDYYRDADYEVKTATSGTPISLVSGQIVFISQTGILTGGGAPFSGYGYYTYTGSTTLTGINTALNYSGGIASGFTYNGISYGYQQAVTFVFYHTRGTTTPIPGSGDYRILFAKTVPANTQTVDCSDLMPQLAVFTLVCSLTVPTALVISPVRTLLRKAASSKSWPQRAEISSDPLSELLTGILFV